ncbi:Serine/threonine-protein phosphatase PP2A catalytic subunit 2 [Tritrichomonas foetus]|uniref:Serine/threonine-protein phosphatase n=1 Tax=Tritrichomonas foetus TaxID=1144522 RepID=A0A1J4KYU5_9EUKA|nr:Serine/threonine-protein phosphatase PP2A catalytic subunit 2 [Tritrichomonas foetus]|eukprot:OHT14749.1 Serine/threonine-protein phosphatase PP2A catalytic subunit 2 [Tritrichomonas foetus]
MFVSSTQVLAQYQKIYKHENFKPNKVGTEFPLPKFSQLILFDLLNKAKEFFKDQPALVRTTCNTVIIGDLHGSIADLLRIMNEMSKRNYQLLFLGDYVDRGSYSIEVITLLLSLILEHPNRVFLLRGNHEFREINQKYGFYDQIKQEYNNDLLYEEFNNVFDYMPLAAIVGTKTLCVHGGLSPYLNKIEDIEKIDRPVRNFDDRLLRDLMWSDPTHKTSGYVENARGMGQSFGCMVVKLFLSTNAPIERIIRAHQCVDAGVEMPMKNTVYTVFSASNYCKKHRNWSGMIMINEQNELSAANFEPIDAIPREECQHTIVQTVQGSASQIIAKRNTTLCYNLLKKSRPSITKETSMGMRKNLSTFVRTKSVVYPLLPQLFPKEI